MGNEGKENGERGNRITGNGRRIRKWEEDMGRAEGEKGSERVRKGEVEGKGMKREKRGRG